MIFKLSFKLPLSYEIVQELKADSAEEWRAFGSLVEAIRGQVLTASDEMAAAMNHETRRIADRIYAILSVKNAIAAVRSGYVVFTDMGEDKTWTQTWAVHTDDHAYGQFDQKVMPVSMVEYWRAKPEFRAWLQRQGRVARGIMAAKETILGIMGNPSDVELVSFIRQLILAKGGYDIEVNIG